MNSRRDRSEDHQLLLETGKQAAALALDYWNSPIRKDRKPDGSVVTDADKAIDALFAEKLRTARPDYGWFSEESMASANRREARRVFILDPIDGTRAFVQGRDDWTVALTLVEEGTPVLAVVINPVRAEVFDAQEGSGAFLNGERIYVSPQAELLSARLAVPEGLLHNKRWREPWPKVRRISINSILYRLAEVAAGRADATFSLTPKWEWDVAAGALLVAEAGGIVTDSEGHPLLFNSAEEKVQGFLAATPKLHQKLLGRLSGADGATANAGRS